MKVGIGVFEVKSSQIVVTDPCYGAIGVLTSDAGNRYQLNDAIESKPGLWVASVALDKSGRVFGMLAQHIEHMGARGNWAKHEFEDTKEWGFCVDSGTMMFCDLGRWPNIDPGGEIFKLMTREHLPAGVLDAAAVCSTGWGDGEYPLFVLRERNTDGPAVGLWIDFNEYEDDSDEVAHIHNLIESLR